MQYKNIIIGADEMWTKERELITEAISEHIIELGLATPETLTGFTWRLDVRMRTDDDTV